MITEERLAEIEKICAPNKAVLIDRETTYMMVGTIAELTAEIRRLRGALKFYAEENKWEDESGDYITDILYEDSGKRARQALGE